MCTQHSAHSTGMKAVELQNSAHCCCWLAVQMVGIIIPAAFKASTGLTPDVHVCSLNRSGGHQKAYLMAIYWIRHGWEGMPWLRHVRTWMLLILGQLLTNHFESQSRSGHIMASKRMALSLIHSSTAPMWKSAPLSTTHAKILEAPTVYPPPPLEGCPRTQGRF